MNNHFMIVKKESFFKKVLNKIKMFFKFETEDSFEIDNEIALKKDEKLMENTTKNFLDNLKVQVDTQIYALKFKLENGEIRAIDLTDEQIDKLQKIYDEEIHVKKNRLATLKQSV